jgi:hypothetical protein
VIGEPLVLFTSAVPDSRTYARTTKAMDYLTLDYYPGVILTKKKHVHAGAIEEAFLYLKTLRLGLRGLTTSRESLPTPCRVGSVVQKGGITTCWKNIHLLKSQLRQEPSYPKISSDLQ